MIFVWIVQLAFGSIPKSGSHPGIQRSSDGEPVFVTKETCPDAELQGDCEAQCRIEYNRCRLLCETEYCQSICEREYQDCGDNCPCGENCEQGCFNCENPICPQETTMTSQTAITTISPSDVNILILGFSDLTDSYVFSGEGFTNTPAAIDAPRDDYAYRSASAVVRGELYIFGGQTDYRKIAKLEDCEFEEVPVKLVDEFWYGHFAIAIDGGDKALICFDRSSFTNCEIFDAVSSALTYSTPYPHENGGLGYLNGQPTTVGSARGDGQQKVETYSSSGWTRLADHPRNIQGHTLTGLKSGALFMAGGYDQNEREYTRSIWLLKEDVWRLTGFLEEYCYRGSALKIGDFIYRKYAWSGTVLTVPDQDYFLYAISGGVRDSNGLYPVERIKVVNDEIVNTEIIGGHDFLSWHPVIFEATADFCV